MRRELIRKKGACSGDNDMLQRHLLVLIVSRIEGALVCRLQSRCSAVNVFLTRPTHLLLLHGRKRGFPSHPIGALRTVKWPTYLPSDGV